jgi:hypothetical protein
LPDAPRTIRLLDSRNMQDRPHRFAETIYG